MTPRAPQSMSRLPPDVEPFTPMQRDDGMRWLIAASFMFGLATGLVLTLITLMSFGVAE